MLEHTRQKYTLDNENTNFNLGYTAALALW